VGSESHFQPRRLADVIQGACLFLLIIIITWLFWRHSTHVSTVYMLTARSVTIECRCKVKVVPYLYERMRVLELIPVQSWTVSPLVTEAINTAVGFHYFPSARDYLPSSRASLAATTKLYCLVTEAHVCKQLVQRCAWQHGSRNLSSQPADHKASTLSTLALSHPKVWRNNLH